MKTKLCCNSSFWIQDSDVTLGGFFQAHLTWNVPHSDGWSDRILFCVGSHTSPLAAGLQPHLLVKVLHFKDYNDTKIYKKESISLPTGCKYDEENEFFSSHEYNEKNKTTPAGGHSATN